MRKVAGRLFTRHARRDDWLRQYAQVFNTVEGNSTFYGLPSHNTVQRWAEAVETGFRFVLKFPREISHEKRLLRCDAETDAFLDVLEVLRGAGCLGPSFLQLPSGFSAHHLEDLRKYLGRLPAEYPYAVEVRNADFFAGGQAEQSLNQLLAELGINRVILDSRPLFSAPPDTEYETASQGRKPRVPVHTTVTGTRPILRLIGATMCVV